MSRKRLSLVAAAIAVFTLVGTTKTLAIWSEVIWNSGYNLVLRPESDTIKGGSVDVWVQNNTCAILPNFALFADGVAAKRITCTRTDHTFLLPGENSHFTITSAKTAAVSSLKFTVHFGWHEEVKIYLEGATPLVVQDSKGTITPSTDPASDFAKDSIKNSLRYTAQLDFSPNTVQAMGLLLDAFCAGRATWTPGTIKPTCNDCRNQDFSTCPQVPANAKTGQIEYDGLFELVHIAIAKAAILPDLLAKLRSRLICASKDPNDNFSSMAIFVLGYLGDDPTARTYLEGLTADAKRGVVAKAALVVMGKADDSTKYMAAVRAGMAGGTVTSAICMATVTIAAKDATAAAKLIDLTYWNDTDQNPLQYTASHLLAIAAWDQKRWGPKATEGVAVSFYKDDQKSWPCTKPYTGPTATRQRRLPGAPESMKLIESFPAVTVYLKVERPTLTEMRILSLNGACVRSMKTTMLPGASPALRFRCDDLTPGTYIVNINAAGMQYAGKIAMTGR